MAIFLHPRFLFWLWVLLWFGRLYLVPIYYVRTQALGYYPPHADSIAIPVVGNIMFTIITAPFIAWGFRSFFRASPAQYRSWFNWCSARPVASLAWTLLFCACALFSLQSFRESIAIDLPLHAVADLCWTFFWLATRSIVVSRLYPIHVRLASTGSA
jgi:hypothetical protein